jgi:hypothetical protein
MLSHELCLAADLGEHLGLAQIRYPMLQPTKALRVPTLVVPAGIRLKNRGRGIDLACRLGKGIRSAIPRR